MLLLRNISYSSKESFFKLAFNNTHSHLCSSPLGNDHTKKGNTFTCRKDSQLACGILLFRGTRSYFSSIRTTFWPHSGRKTTHPASTVLVLGRIWKRRVGDACSSGHTEAQESNSLQWDWGEVPKEGWKLSRPGRVDGIQEEHGRKIAA